MNSRAQLTALVDPNGKNLTAAEKLFPNVAHYASLARCLRTEQPDIVVIATPPSARRSLIMQCVKAGVRILVCEKPIARSLTEAQAIEKVVKVAKVTLVLNYQRRFSPLFARARARIAAGKLGRIQQVTCYYSNGLYNNGGHIIDTLLYLLDDDVVSVVALQNNHNRTYPAGDENIDALLTTRKGTVVALQSFDQRSYGTHELRIYGTEGSAILADYGLELMEYQARPSRFVGVRLLDAARARVTHAPLSATRGALAEAIQCHEQHRAPRSGAHNGILVTRTLEAISNCAARGGKRVFIKP
jgi:predicted dehydrogenase